MVKLIGGEKTTPPVSDRVKLYISINTSMPLALVTSAMDHNF